MQIYKNSQDWLTVATTESGVESTKHLSLLWRAEGPTWSICDGRLMHWERKPGDGVHGGRRKLEPLQWHRSKPLSFLPLLFGSGGKPIGGWSHLHPGWFFVFSETLQPHSELCWFSLAGHSLHKLTELTITRTVAETSLAYFWPLCYLLWCIHVSHLYFISKKCTQFINIYTMMLLFISAF